MCLTTAQKDFWSQCFIQEYTISLLLCNTWFHCTDNCTTSVLHAGFLWLHSVFIAVSWIIHVSTQSCVTSAAQYKLSLWMEKCRALILCCKGFFLWMQSRPSPQNWGYSGTVWAWLQSVCIAAPWITHTDTHTEHRYAGVQLLDIKMRTAHEISSSSSGARSHSLLLRYKNTYLHFAKPPGQQTLIRAAGVKE